MSQMIDTAGDDIPTRRNWFSFWSLLTLQTQNAFNDKAAQFLLIPLAALLALNASESGQDVGFIGKNMTHVLGALMVLPFILFAPLAGWVSDQFSKTMVIRGTLCVQFVVLLLICGAVWMQSLPLAVFGFFLLSVESVLLSPAKKGITKELVGHSRLGFASGVLEMSVILAVCAGQIISGLWFDAGLKSGRSAWDAAFFPLTLVAAGAFLSLGVSLCVERVPSIGHRKFEAKILIEHFGQLKEVWENRKIRLSGVGVAFFWGFAGFINLVAIQIGKDLSGGGGQGFATENSWLMLAASGGIAIGGVIASLISRKKIELGLVPLGGLVMVVGSLALGFGPIERGWVMAWLAISGAGGALLLVPLNAYLQDECPPESRGKILAGLNLMDCLAGLLAVAVQFAMAHWKLPYGAQFGALAVVSLLVTCYSTRLLPQQFARFLLLSAFRSIYRIRTLNEDQVPKEGGVLLTPNHVSYIDAFILSVACPRSIQFVLFDEYFSHRFVGRIVRLFDAIPISATRAKDGLRIAAKSLEEGNVVCIFPEGQLTRTGGMNAFMRGFEMIARRAKCPVLPAAMDGVWGSIFSFERNRFLKKKPYTLQYGVTVNFGELIPAREAGATVVRRRIDALRAEAFAERSVLQKPSRVLGRSVKVLAGDVAELNTLLEKLRKLPENQQREVVANALQMSELNAIQRGQTLMLDLDGLDRQGSGDGAQMVVGCCLAQWLDLQVVVVSDSMPTSEMVSLAKKYHVDQWVGGARLAEVWMQNDVAGGCFDFSEDALTLVREGGGKSVFPCLMVDGKVISMSMPHPAQQTEINEPQDGHRRGTWGHLLPGFEVECDEAGLTLTGVSCKEKPLRIQGGVVEGDGMVVVR